MIQFIPQTLLADSNVTAIVQNRVKPSGTNQGDTFPYITFQVVSDVPGRCREGIYTQSIRVQVSVFAKTYSAKEALFEAVKTALDGATGDRVFCEWLNANDLYREPGDKSTDAHGKAIDFELILG
jgi:hypothetical protein